jgi:copper(I)-binding protein
VPLVLSRRALSAVALLVTAALVVAACGSGSASSPGGSGSLTAASAAASSVAGISVRDAWARPAPAGGSSAAYMTVANVSGVDDALLSVSSSAGDAQVHQSTMGGSGMTGMQAVDRVVVPAGGSVELQPGGYHVMLMDLRGNLVVGSTIQLDLVFEHAGKVVVQAAIRQG